MCRIQTATTTAVKLLDTTRQTTKYQTIGGNSGKTLYGDHRDETTRLCLPTEMLLHA